MRGEGIEPSCRETPAPRAGASTISPPTHSELPRGLEPRSSALPKRCTSACASRAAARHRFELCLSDLEADTLPSVLAIQSETWVSNPAPLASKASVAPRDSFPFIAPRGLEPRLTGSEPAVLPLDESASKIWWRRRMHSHRVYGCDPLLVPVLSYSPSGAVENRTRRFFLQGRTGTHSTAPMKGEVNSSLPLFARCGLSPLSPLGSHTVRRAFSPHGEGRSTKSARSDLNRLPSAYQTDALPGELRAIRWEGLEPSSAAPQTAALAR